MKERAKPATKARAKTKPMAPAEPVAAPAPEDDSKGKFRPEMVDQVRKLAQLGATDMEIADFFEVGIATVKRWKHSHPDFFEAMTLGKDAADSRVVRALFSRAVGYEHEDVDIRVADNVVVMTPIRKHYPPDTTACIFWLKNRQRELWRVTEHPEGKPDGGDLAAVLRAVADKLPV